MIDKNKIKEIGKETIGLFDLTTKLKENGFKAEIVDFFGNRILKLDNKNIICSRQLSNSKDFVNDSLCFDTL